MMKPATSFCSDLASPAELCHDNAKVVRTLSCRLKLSLPMLICQAQQLQKMPDLISYHGHGS